MEVLEQSVPFVHPRTTQQLVVQRGACQSVSLRFLAVECAVVKWTLWLLIVNSRLMWIVDLRKASCCLNVWVNTVGLCSDGVSCSTLKHQKQCLTFSWLGFWPTQAYSRTLTNLLLHENACFLGESHALKWTVLLRFRHKQDSLF